MTDEKTFEEFKEELINDDDKLQELFKVHKEATGPPFAEAMEKFVGDLLQKTKETVQENTEKIVQDAIAATKQDSLSQVRKSFGLDEDRPVMMSDLPGLIRKAMQEALEEQAEKRSEEEEGNRDGGEGDEGELDVKKRYKELNPKLVGEDE